MIEKLRYENNKIGDANYNIHERSNIYVKNKLIQGIGSSIYNTVSIDIIKSINNELYNHISNNDQLISIDDIEIKEGISEIKS